MILRSAPLQLANMRMCGAGEQPLTVFYNHEKRRVLSKVSGQADAGQRFDQGFVQCRPHMQLLRAEAQFKPDQAPAKAWPSVCCKRGADATWPHSGR